MEHDRVTWAHRLHQGTNVNYFSYTFMPEKMREKAIRSLDCVDLVDLSSADAAVPDPHQHLARTQRAR
jgi:hypothetical protein